MARSLEERFWEKVIKPSEEACWGWRATKNNKGYGMIRRGPAKDSKLLAHRVSYEIQNGEIPDGLCVLHHCDNPICTNPRHLFLGTHQDNALDKVRKGRHRWGNDPNNKPPVYLGVMHPRARFNTSEIEDIRRRLSFGEAARAIARSFNVDKSLILKIKHGRTYVSVGLGG